MALSSKKQRLDTLLVERGLVESRTQAQALILAGQVVVNEGRVDKPGQMVLINAEIRLKDVQRFVSRGGLKLEKALQTFPVRVSDSVCLDVGVSTGGFSDCLLQHGAKKIYGVDVGQNQLHWKLVKDPRVTLFEKTNFRHMDAALIPEPIDLCVMDVSFISIAKLLPNVVNLLKKNPKGAQIVFLIKPQFEVTPAQVGKGGIVRDQTLQDQVAQNFVKILSEVGFADIAVIDSPVLGADGNREFLIFGNYRS